MPTVLITGASRGLGLEFARAYAADGWTVLACCRSPERAAALRALSGQIEALTLDVSDPAAAFIVSTHLQGRSLDLLINNAGLFGGEDLDPHDWLRVLSVNVIGPALLTEALLPNLRLGCCPKVAFLSSRMGSIADNSSGGSTIYRSSKAALNATVHSLAMDWKHESVTLLLLHPGWVKTDMGGANAPLTAEVSVKGMRRVIAAATSADNGTFLDYTGDRVPW